MENTRIASMDPDEIEQYLTSDEVKELFKALDTIRNYKLVAKNLKLEVKEGTHPSPTITLEMAEADYLGLVNGKISGEKAFLMGKVRFKGNIALALKLREMGFL